MTTERDKEQQLATNLFYGLIGVSASLLLFVVFYWSLRLNASIDNLVRNFIGTPLYFWPYVIFTIATLILFGINAALFVYRWRKFGPPKLAMQGGTGIGSLVGIAASGCPICGSVILSAIGITGGLAAFPLGGLELKALSFVLMALPIWLTAREIKHFEGCEGKSCPVPRDHTFKETDRPYFGALVALVLILILIAYDMLKTDPFVLRVFAKNALLNPSDNTLYSLNNFSTANTLYDETVAKVLPERGFQSKIFLGDSVVKLVRDGVIDKDKFESIYKERGGLPEGLKNILTQSSYAPILLTRQNANYYVNLLWPLGLANFMATNRESPIAGKSLFNFASTGGWTLGREENGGTYFNKFRIVPLSSQQEALVTKIAKAAHRPCCNNSTFYQDCNHGSALLGLLALGASQGLTEEELYKEALAFNSFWFPHQYVQTALYFKVIKGTEWEHVDPKLLLSKDFSSGSGWAGNVQAQLAKIPNHLPKTKDGAQCGT